MIKKFVLLVVVVVLSVLFMGVVGCIGVDNGILELEVMIYELEGSFESSLNVLEFFE